MKITTLYGKVESLPKYKRRLILVLLDTILLLLAVILSINISYPNELFANLRTFNWILVFSTLIGIPIFIFTGQYKGITKYMNSSFVYLLFFRKIFLSISIICLGSILQKEMPINTFWIVNLFFNLIFIGLLRFLVRDFLLSLQKSAKKNIKNVVIYGAGSAGAQLAASLNLDKSHNVIYFLDDDKNLIGRNLYGIPIKSLKYLRNNKDSIDQILLAIPSLDRKRKFEIFNLFKGLKIPLLEIPSIDELTTGKATINQLRSINITEILGRDKVPSDPKLMGPSIKGKVICVTGAGGSIGSELSRKILNFNPECLLLLENSETNLYNIHKEISNIYPTISVKPILGDTKNYLFLKKLFSDNQVNVVFHAAAYKHVPLVEINPISGILNNVFSTKSICEAAEFAKVENVILISTDKAVRPTNIMGASKRLSELIVKVYSRRSKLSPKTKGGEPTKYSMVRFGNVLESSGSVVPLFKEQIKNGGPVTLTHPEIIRYFMTIDEAAELVIQSSVLAQGGDIFLLDMGTPIKIKELAKQMIELSGLTIKDDNNQEGDIEIIYTGLRNGEKLYEELLVDGTSRETSHPRIFRADESFEINEKELWGKLNLLEENIKNNKQKVVLEILKSLVPEWTYSSQTNI